MIRIITTLEERRNPDGTIEMVLLCQSETEIAGESKTTNSEKEIGDSFVIWVQKFSRLLEKTAREAELPWWKRILL
jgi:hypothetical protein